jgi:hypothetical protein
MKLDKTRVVIRERAAIDTFDLTLHVLWTFAPRLIPALLAGIVPLALLDYFLVGWLDDRIDLDPLEGSAPRYLWHYTLLVFVQGPVASLLGVAYLSGAVFRQEKSLFMIVRELLSVSFSLLISQGVLRCTLLATLLPLALSEEPNELVEGLALVALAAWVALLRALRPYVNEIVVLERAPFWPRRPGVISFHRRSPALHSPNGGDLVVQWLGSALLAAVATGVVYGSLLTITAVMAGIRDPLHPFSLHVLYPVSLWTVAAYFGVARFLGYLDLRIRQEGWEVELLIKAEAARLAEKIA